MRSRCISMTVFLLFFAGVLLAASQARSATLPPVEGGTLPEMRLPIPKKIDEQKYLGIKDDAFFKIPKAKAEVVIVEVFSMYCPFCQKEAPVVNELYRIVEGRPDLKGKVKILGIGAGNSPFEVNAFKTLYNIPFPLFADTDFALHNALGQVRTPYFIVIKINPGGSHKVIYSRVGGLGDPYKFLDLVVKKPEPRGE